MLPMPSPHASLTAFEAARVWTLDAPGPLHDGAVLAAEGRIQAVLPRGEVPAEAARVPLGDVDLAPGFVDVQVNGGGGALFNDAPDLACLETIAAAHLRFGTTTLLPTLITDRQDVIAAARAAIDAAIDAVPGVAGVHFEGPFLDPRKSGAHDRELVRAPEPGDVDAMFGAGRGVTLVTGAAVHLAGGLLEELLSRGALVSLGHCAATADEAAALFDRGVSCVTHLYNAMSPLQHRAPGVVGAAFAHDRVVCGLIADGVHVEFAAARAAWKALGTDRVALVTDAVHPVGTDMTSFELGGQRVQLEGGRCVNEEGNLAGSALDMASAVRGAVQGMGVPLEDALAMASRTPARLIGLREDRGVLRAGARADLVALDADQRVRAVVQAGARVDQR